MTIGKEDFLIAIDECVKRWPQLAKQVDVYYDHLKFMAFEAFRSNCDRFVEDFRSMPLIKDFKEAYGEWKEKQSYRRPELEDETGFRIFYGVNCKKCGRKNVICIQEPIGAENICRRCYTGLTDKKISNKFTEIISILEAKNAMG